MGEIDKGSADGSDLVDELLGQFERAVNVEIEIIAHRAVHQSEGMHAEIGNHVVLKVVEAERVGNAGSESRLRGEAHRVVVADVKFDEFLITARQVHPQEMLAAFGQGTVQNLRQAVDFLLHLVDVEIGREGRMDAHVGIVAKGLDERLEGLLADGDVLVVGIIFTAKDKVYRIDFERLLQFKLKIEGIERVFPFARTGSPWRSACS